MMTSLDVTSGPGSWTFRNMVAGPARSRPWRSDEAETVLFQGIPFDADDDGLLVSGCILDRSALWRACSSDQPLHGTAIMTDLPAPTSRLRLAPLALAAGLLVLEFLLIGLVFKHGIDFDCRANWGDAACGIASKSLAALYCIIAAGGLFAILRPGLFRDLLAAEGHDARPLALNLAGIGLAMAPVLFLREGMGAAMIWPAFALWGIGMGLVLTGLLGWLAPWPRWRAFLGQAGLPLAVVLAAGGLAPALAVRLQPIWQIETISDMTFRAVSFLVETLGYQLYVDPLRKHIGEGDFIISVAPACSGIEGIALVTIFVSLYLWLFRSELRFPRAFLLFPIGIAASVALNVVRIAVLLLIGIEGQPELAVGGFHSHAGWLMFTIVALGIILVARRVPALHHAPVARAAAAPLPPLWRDPVAARILPFAVFMLTAVAAPAISQHPAMLYPIRVILVAAAVALVWPALRSIVWRVSPLSWLAGILIGVMWVLIPVTSSDGPPPLRHAFGWAGSALVPVPRHRYRPAGPSGRRAVLPRLSGGTPARCCHRLPGTPAAGDPGGTDHRGPVCVAA